MGLITVLQVLVYIFLSFFTGSFLIMMAAKPSNLDVIANYLTDEIFTTVPSKIAVILSGALIILLALRYVESLVLIREKSIKLPQGKVSIAISAIEEMLKRSLEGKRQISGVKPKLILKKRGIEVITKCNLAAEVNLMDLTNEVQEIIKQRLHNLFGEKEEIKVKLKIKKMSLGGKNIEEEDEPRTPFRSYE